MNTTTLITDYFMTDALGSVRQLTDAQGEITLANAYEPYGVLAQTAGSAQTSYGFTGEFTDPSGMVYLRARYYSPTIGRFQTRDTWMGDYNSPLSLNRWMYVEGNPVNFIDPSGNSPAASGAYPRHCQSMPTKAQYETCVLMFFGLEPIDLTGLGETVTGSIGCYTGPSEFRAPGYIEGLSFSLTAGIGYMAGIEVVYDFATMQREIFTYGGRGYQYSIGFADAQYLGTVKGFKTSVPTQKYDITTDYSGIFINTVAGLTIGTWSSINFGVNVFQSPSDPMIRGTTFYIGGSVGKSIISPGDFGQYKLNYVPWSAPPWNYFLGDGSVDLGRLQSDIRSGNLSPLLWFGGVTPGATQIYRNYQANLVFKYVFAYQAIRFQEVIGW